MAVSSGVHGYGTLLAQGSATTTVNNVPEVISADIDGVKVGVTDFTHLASDNAYKENKPGFGEPPMINAELNYGETAYAALVALQRTQVYWRLTYPDSSYWLGFGHITELSVKVPDDGRVTVSLKVQLSGKPTFTVV